MAEAILSLHASGHSTIEIMSATSPGGTYRLAYGSWAPPVPERATGLLRKGPPYKPMEWEFAINIHEADAPTAYEAYQDLVDMLAHVPAWRAGDIAVNGSVYVSYRPKNSSRTDPLTTTIQEFVEISTPKNFLETGDDYTIRDIRVRFITAPGYYDTALADTVTDTSLHFIARNTSDLTFFHNIYSPLRYQALLVVPTASAPATDPPKITLFATAVNGMSIQPCVQPSGTGSNGYSSVADVANKAPYNVLRWSPPTISAWYAVPGAVSMWSSSELSKSGTMLAYILCRSNNNVNFKIRARFSPDSSPSQIGREVAIPYNNGKVQLIYLGAFAFGTNPGGLIGPEFAFELQVDSLTGPPTLDLCSMITVLDQPSSTVVTMELHANETLTTREFRIDPRMTLQTALPRPEVGKYFTGPTVKERNLRYEGNAYPVMWGQEIVHTMIFPYGTNWRMPDSTGASVAGYTFTATRAPMYLSPF